MSDRRLESALDTLHGPREKFREMLTNKDEILADMCEYARREGDRDEVPPWSIVSDITGHGSGVSNAIYNLYRKRD